MSEWVIQPPGSYGAPQNWVIKTHVAASSVATYAMTHRLDIDGQWQGSVTKDTHLLSSCGAQGFQSFNLHDYNWMYDRVPEYIISIWREWFLTLLGKEPYCKLAVILNGKSVGTQKQVYEEVRKLGIVIHEWQNPHPVHTERESYTLQLVRFE